jgi:hypothetical protein
VPASDPAAALLGTDDEAARTPPPAAVVQRGRTAETAARGELKGVETAASMRRPAGPGRGMIAAVVIGFIAIALAAAAIFMLLR